MRSPSLSVTFFGAAQTVTGSKTLLNYKDKKSTKVLIDCGLFQGPKSLRLANWKPWVIAREIKALCLTHAHLDHCGLIPKLVKDGFSGPIYCTQGTFDLARIILLDSAKLQEEDALFANKSGYSNHRPAIPLYTKEDALRSFDRFVPVERHQWVEIDEGLSLEFSRAGHILGSNFIRLAWQQQQKERFITFSGDMGAHRSQIIRGAENPGPCDDLVLESTYGDRVRSEAQTQAQILKQLEEIIHTAWQKQGVVIIPAFSVGRTQEVLWLIDYLSQHKKIPKIPVFVDSPMALEATRIYERHPEDLKWTVEGQFLVPALKTIDFHAVDDGEKSYRLSKAPGPFIVIAGSGMATGGRVMHHLKERLPHKQNSVIFVGYQASETKGRLLVEGIQSLRIHHQEIPVKAQIHMLSGLSAHAYSDELIDWIKSMSTVPKRIFLNHGEEDSLKSFKNKLEKELGVQIIIAQEKLRYEL